MTKRLSQLILVFFIFSLFTFPVSARQIKNASPSANKQAQILDKLEALKQNLQNKKDEHQLRVEEKRASIAAHLSQIRQRNAKRHFTKLSQRMDAALNRLERLITRISSRLNKIEGENADFDTTEIRVKLEDTEGKLAELKSALNEAKLGLDTVLESEDPKASFADFKALIKEIKLQLVDIHRTLVKVIGDIKGLRVGQEVE